LTGGHFGSKMGLLIASWIFMHILTYIFTKSNFKTIKANRSPNEKKSTKFKTHTFTTS